MKNLGKLIIATIVAAASISCGAFASKPTQLPTATLNDEATIVVDQSFTSASNMGAEINSGYLYIAQTFTAQADGILVGVSLDVTASSIGNYRLHVAIRPVGPNGQPAPTVLGETTLDARSAPPARIISFPQTIFIRAGDHYAIVVNYEGGANVKGKTLGMWAGATGDPYPGGKPFSSESDGLTWTTTTDGDFHFQTFVMIGPVAGNDQPVPTTAAGSLIPTYPVGLPVPTMTVPASGPAVPSSKIHLSVTIEGLTNKKDQLALWSGDNESHRYCFTDCRDTSDFVRVKADQIVVSEGFPVTYDQWGVMLDLAPNPGYAANSLEVDILFRGESWVCVNDQGKIEPRSEYQMIYVASVDPLNYTPPVAAMPPFFSCSKQ